MFLRIEEIVKRNLIGKSVKMTMINNKTGSLWQGFMPHVHEIKNRANNFHFALQRYDSSQSFSEFNPNTEFEQCAAVEVTDNNNVPEGMQSIDIPAGTYAVFNHKGLVQDFPKTMHYIFGEWMPSSGYQLDDKPQFQLMGEKYINNHPDSEEEVWIPVIKLGV